jgi:hypothetical protein
MTIGPFDGARCDVANFLLAMGKCIGATFGNLAI